jgi:hypothetical protein
MSPFFSIPALVAGVLVVSNCASAIGQEQSSAQANRSMQLPADQAACPSKWVAAGNDGAKAGRYFLVSCGQRETPLAQEQSPPGQDESDVQANASRQAQADPPVCPSKWIAAGNNGAKADRYFKVSC